MSVVTQERIEEFMQYLVACNRSPNTLKSYRQDLMGFVAFTGPQPLDRKVVTAYISSLHGKLGRGSIRRVLAAIKSFSKWLDRASEFDAALIRSIKGPRPHDQLMEVPSEADMSKLLEGDIPSPCPERDRVILEMLYGSGLRVQEMADVNLSDFDEEGLLVRGKGMKERKVPVGGAARRAIEAWLPVRKKLLEESGQKTDALVFSVSPHSSKRLTVRSIRRMVKAVAMAKGLPVYHPHQLRHAFATHLLDHGASLQHISRLLGEAKLSTAQIYTRVSVGRMMEVYKRAHPHAKK